MLPIIDIKAPSFWGRNVAQFEYLQCLRPMYKTFSDFSANRLSFLESGCFWRIKSGNFDRWGPKINIITNIFSQL